MTTFAKAMESLKANHVVIVHKAIFYYVTSDAPRILRLKIGLRATCAPPPAVGDVSAEHIPMVWETEELTPQDADRLVAGGAEDCRDDVDSRRLEALVNERNGVAG